MWKIMLSTVLGSIGATLSLFLPGHGLENSGGASSDSNDISTEMGDQLGSFDMSRGGRTGGRFTTPPPLQSEPYGFNEADHNRMLRTNIDRLTLISGVPLIHMPESDGGVNE